MGFRARDGDVAHLGRRPEYQATLCLKFIYAQKYYADRTKDLESLHVILTGENICKSSFRVFACEQHSVGSKSAVLFEP
jgi:hypothetical protein